MQRQPLSRFNAIPNIAQWAGERPSNLTKAALPRRLCQSVRRHGNDLLGAATSLDQARRFRSRSAASEVRSPQQQAP
jgi:hypothetical protein